MRRLFSFAITLASASIAAPEIMHAQTAARTFLATTGSDANPCSALAPCRTLGVAINAVAAGGDVLILDSGGFGENVTITKSVSVIASPGIVARLKSSAGGFAVRINASSINVTLDGLGITGTSGIGVRFSSGRSLILRNMDFAGMVSGVQHNASDGHLSMHKVTVRDCGNGLLANGTSANPAFATVTDSQFVNCGFGINASNNSLVTARRTIVSGDGTKSFGCVAFESSGIANKPATLVLKDVVATNCDIGLEAQGATAAIVASKAVVSGHATAGKLLSSATGLSYGDNTLFGNTANAFIGFGSAASQ